MTEANDDVDEIACRVNQKQDACLHRSNRCRCGTPARVVFRAAARKNRRNSAASRNDEQKHGGTGRTGRPQFRLRVFQTKKMKATINPAAISIQYWPSKPRNAKRLMRNCTVPVPVLCRISGLLGQDRYFGNQNILFLYFWPAGPRSTLAVCAAARAPGALAPSNVPVAPSKHAPRPIVERAAVGAA